MDDWNEEAPRANPLLATLAGIAVLIAAAILGPLVAPQQPLNSLLLAGAGLALLVWLVGLVVTLRRAPLLWSVGSLVVLLAAGVGAGLVTHGQYQTRARADASSFAEIELAPDGRPLLPGGIAGRGPISALYAQAVQADMTEQRQLGEALGKFGLASLNSPYLLEQNPHAIADCGALDAIDGVIAQQASRRAERSAALDRAIARASLPDAAKRGIAAIAVEPAGDPLRANQQAMLAAARELCTLLAKRSWFNAMGYFGFRNPADKAAHAALQRRLQAAAAEGDALARARRDRIGQGRDQVRDVLSRSIYAGS
jgi:hypothetical protein